MNFDETLILRLKKMEREVERLKVGEKADNTGWIPVSSAWTYASATTINVPSGAAAIYKVGQGVKLKHNGAQNWFYITAVADTQLTITGGSDYPFTSSGSNTLSEISYTNTPGTAIGFPSAFNFTPVFTSLTVTGSPIYSGKFWMSGILKFYSIQINPNGGTTASSFGSTLVNNPIAQSGFTVPVAVFYTSSAVGDFGETSTTQTYLPTWTTNSGHIFISATYI